MTLPGNGRAKLMRRYFCGKFAAMLEQRRYQRIRFGTAPSVRIGFNGQRGEGSIENLSLMGLMARSEIQLEVGRNIGLEFRIPGAERIDVAATVVSRVGSLFGVRFLSGPLNLILVEDAINAALSAGQASVLTLHELGGRKVMRISGGLLGNLRNDFMHALTRVGVEEIDLSGVTAVEQAGLGLCMVATSRYGVTLGERSACFDEAWRLAMAMPGALDDAEDWGRDTQIRASMVI